MATISKQQAKRLAAEARAAAEAVPTVPDSHEQYLAGYLPEKLNPTTWRAVRSTHHEIMRRSRIEGLESFKKRCTELATYLAGRHEAGQSIAIADAMTFAAIEEHIARRLDHLNDKVKATHRSRLRNLALAVNPGLDAPMHAASTGYRTIRPPYDARDEQVIKRVAMNQRNPGARRNLCAVVGLAAGAGLDSIDLRELRVSDIHDHGEDGIVIDVPGKRARRSVVRREYETMVRAAIEDMAPGQLVLGQTINRRNIVGNVVAAAEIHGDVPHIDASRLRATWLASLMCRAVPLRVILDAAGLKSVRSLTDLLDHLPTHDSADEAVLREGGQR